MVCLNVEVNTESCRSSCTGFSSPLNERDPQHQQLQHPPNGVLLTLQVGIECLSTIQLNLTRTVDTVKQHRIKTSPLSAAAAGPAAAASVATDGNHQHVRTASAAALPVLIGERGRVLRWNISHDGQVGFQDAYKL